MAIRLVKVSFDEYDEWKVEKNTWLGEDGRKLKYDCFELLKISLLSDSFFKFSASFKMKIPVESKWIIC